MSEPAIAQCFVDLARSLQRSGIKRPASIELASKEEALKIVWEVDAGRGRIWSVQLLSSASCESVAHKIESGEMQSFLLFGIEFWWRPSPAAVEAQQCLKAAA
jgi:hypothetical protein